MSYTRNIWPNISVMKMLEKGHDESSQAPPCPGKCEKKKCQGDTTSIRIFYVAFFWGLRKLRAGVLQEIH